MTSITSTPTKKQAKAPGPKRPTFPPEGSLAAHVERVERGRLANGAYFDGFRRGQGAALEIVAAVADQFFTESAAAAADNHNRRGRQEGKKAVALALANLVEDLLAEHDHIALAGRWVGNHGMGG